jgi:hypothetical protein
VNGDPDVKNPGNPMCTGASMRGSLVARRACRGENRMNFATATDRVRGDFTEMPGLELTMGQAIRLWNLGADDCRYVLDALVDAGFLRWTARRTIRRADRVTDDEPRKTDELSYTSVLRTRRPDISRSNS